jgi:ureidoglycolate hydrolase
MRIRRITQQSFRRFGTVIELSARKASRGENLFRVVLRDARAAGWRIAYLVVRERMITRLERHPGTFESFEPVKGKCILFVARGSVPRRIEGFLLDRPVVLRKDVWHGVVACDREADIKITENASVRCVYVPLKKPLPHK